MEKLKHWFGLFFKADGVVPKSIRKGYLEIMSNDRTKLINLLLLANLP